MKNRHVLPKSADLIGNFKAFEPFLHQMMMFSSVSCHSTAVRFFLIRKFINQTRRAQKSPSNKEGLMLLVRLMPIFLCSIF